MKTALIIAALTLGGLATAQTVSPLAGRPDVIQVNLGGANLNPLDLRSTYFFGNVAVTEGLYNLPTGQFTGTLRLGNEWQDQNLFLEGTVNWNSRYNQYNYSAYATVRQDIVDNRQLGVYGTSVRFGVSTQF